MHRQSNGVSVTWTGSRFNDTQSAAWPDGLTLGPESPAQLARVMRLMADFRKMYGTDNVEAVTRVAGAFVSFRMYTEEYTGTAYVEIVKI